MWQASKWNFIFTRLLQTLITNPKLTLPVWRLCSKQLSGIRDLGHSITTRVNSPFLPGCAWKLGPAIKRLTGEWEDEGKETRVSRERPQCKEGAPNHLPPRWKCLFVPSWSNVLAGFLFLFFHGFGLGLIWLSELFDFLCLSRTLGDISGSSGISGGDGSSACLLPILGHQQQNRLSDHIFVKKEGEEV